MIDLTAARNRVGAVLNRGLAEVRSVGVLARAGVISPGDPRGALASLKAMNGFGAVGGGIVNAAHRHGSRTGLVDDAGSLTFTELHERSNALAAALASRGVHEGATIGLLARNHRWLFDVVFGAAKGGYHLVLLNTEFAGPQAKDVCEREGVDVLVADEEFLGVVADIAVPQGTYVAWTDTEAEDGRVGGYETLAVVTASCSTADRPAPSRHGRIVILTSGTTGMPKGAPRAQPRSLSGPGAVLDKIPFREAGRVLVAPPVFHSWGLLTALLAVSTGSTVIVTRRFDPVRTLDLLEEHRCTGLIVVPVMLNRMLDVDERPPAERDLQALTFIASSGSKLEPSLVEATMDAFGEVLYNFYGSTEVATAAIGTPEDLRANPASAGRPPLGSVVRLLDEDGREVPPGETGRIFVANSMSFSGYTGGEDKERIDGLVATGDVGHWDEGGRLVVDGRDDDMIVSGGENVFPGEVEDLIADLDEVDEVAVLGVDDPKMGQRLQAFVVVHPGQTLTEAQVRDHVAANLARYKVPRSVTFLDELPRNPTGKVLKRKLRDQI